MNLLPDRKMAILAACLSALMLAAVSEETSDKRADKEFNLDKDGLAIQGYDPVAHFDGGGGQPTPGQASITETVGKTTYRFATAANRDRFRENPAKYEPAYGGWCAYAMGAKGEKVEVNPKAFTITDGKLCLFYKTIITDTRKPWKKDVATLKPKADASWKAIVEKAIAEAK